jgi:hypothetical protein
VPYAPSRSIKVRRLAPESRAGADPATYIWFDITKAYKSSETTLKRHGYYCRSRIRGHQTVRSRSCVACAKAKVRCDNKQPTCSRCILRQLDCHHPSRGSTNRQISENAEGKVLRNIGSQTDLFEPSNTGAAQSIASEDSSLSSAVDLNPLEVGVGPFAWDIVDVESPSTQVLNHENTQQSESYSVASVPLDPAVQRRDDESYTGLASFIRDAYIPEMPTYSLRSFTQKPAIKAGGLRTASLMLRILTSYPLMLRNPESPPPFIHPSYLDHENKSMESLTTCASLMQMLSSGGQGSKSLLWKNVKLECERLHAQVVYL